MERGRAKGVAMSLITEICKENLLPLGLKMQPEQKKKKRINNSGSRPVFFGAKKNRLIWGRVFGRVKVTFSREVF